MRKFIALIVCIVAVANTSWGRDMVLVEFSTDRYDTAMVWLAQLEERGVTARHIFPPNLAIVETHGLSKNWLEGQGVSFTVYEADDLQGKAATGAAGTAQSPKLPIPV